MQKRAIPRQPPLEGTKPRKKKTLRAKLKAAEEEKMVDEPQPDQNVLQSFVDALKSESDTLMNEDRKVKVEIERLGKGVDLVQKFKAFDLREAKFKMKDSYAKKLAEAYTSVSDEERQLEGWAPQIDVDDLNQSLILTNRQQMKVDEWKVYNFQKFIYKKKQPYTMTFQFFPLNFVQMASAYMSMRSEAKKTFDQGQTWQGSIKGVTADGNWPTVNYQASEADLMKNISNINDDKWNTPWPMILKTGDQSNLSMQDQKGLNVVAQMFAMIMNIGAQFHNDDPRKKTMKMTLQGILKQNLAPQDRATTWGGIYSCTGYTMVYQNPIFMNKLLHWKGRGYNLIGLKTSLYFKNDQYQYLNIAHVPGAGSDINQGGIYTIPAGEALTIKATQFDLSDSFIICGIRYLDPTPQITGLTKNADLVYRRSAIENMSVSVSAVCQMLLELPTDNVVPFDPFSKPAKPKKFKFAVDQTKAIVGLVNRNTLDDEDVISVATSINIHAPDLLFEFTGSMRHMLKPDIASTSSQDKLIGYVNKAIAGANQRDKEYWLAMFLRGQPKRGILYLNQHSYEQDMSLPQPLRVAFADAINQITTINFTISQGLEDQLIKENNYAGPAYSIQEVNALTNYLGLPPIFTMDDEGRPLQRLNDISGAPYKRFKLFNGQSLSRQNVLDQINAERERQLNQQMNA